MKFVKGVKLILIPSFFMLVISFILQNNKIKPKLNETKMTLSNIPITPRKIGAISAINTIKRIAQIQTCLNCCIS